MNGLFGQQQIPPDMSVMYPQGKPQIQVPAGMPMNPGMPPQMPQGIQASAPQMNPQQAEEDAMNALAQQQQKPKYSIGDPIVDKYINMFLGA